MQTTLDLPDSLFRQVEQRASHEGRMLNEVAADLLRIGLASGLKASISGQMAQPVVTMNPQTNLPVITSPADAPVHSMTIEQVVAVEQAILEEEDLERAGLPVRH